MASRPTARMVLRRRTQAPKPVDLKVEDGSGSDSEYDGVSCQECGSGDFGSKLLLCDKCDKGYHLFCLRPILVSVPKGSWFCHSCSNRHNKLKCKFTAFYLKKFIWCSFGYSCLFYWFLLLGFLYLMLIANWVVSNALFWCVFMGFIVYMY